jgi:hypothetical protein
LICKGKHCFAYKYSDDCCALFGINYFSPWLLIELSFKWQIIRSCSASRDIACLLYCFLCTSECNSNTDKQCAYIDAFLHSVCEYHYRLEKSIKCSFAIDTQWSLLLYGVNELISTTAMGRANTPLISQSSSSVG